MSARPRKAAARARILAVSQLVPSVICTGVKFGRVEGDVEVPHSYPHVWARDDLSNGSSRLNVAPSGGHVDLLLKLSDCLPEPFRILYVLVVPRGEAEPGRYQSEELTREEVHDFLKSFEGFLESDGRAHLWVASVDPPSPPVGTLVYNRHNLIYAYGPLLQYELVLAELGLNLRESVDIPNPHSHHYNIEMDPEATRILDHWEWMWSPLQFGDEV